MGTGEDCSVSEGCLQLGGHPGPCTLASQKFANEPPQVTAPHTVELARPDDRTIEINARGAGHAVTVRCRGTRTLVETSERKVDDSQWVAFYPPAVLANGWQPYDQPSHSAYLPRHYTKMTRLDLPGGWAMLWTPGLRPTPAIEGAVMDAAARAGLSAEQVAAVRRQLADLRGLDPAALDPDVRRLVMHLRALGIPTTDSGDGVSKPADERALDVPHVFAVYGRNDWRVALNDAERVGALLPARDGGEVTLAYNPHDGQLVLAIVGYGDEDLP